MTELTGLAIRLDLRRRPRLVDAAFVRRAEAVIVALLTNGRDDTARRGFAEASRGAVHTGLVSRAALADAGAPRQAVAATA